MTVAAVMIGADSLDRLAKKISSMRKMSARERGSFARGIAKGIKDLAVRRVRVTKTAPDGTPWRRWSTSYAATRTAQHSLLMDKRNLVRRFVAYASPAGRFVKVSNTAPYAGYVQNKRKFLGLGKQEHELIDTLAEKYFRRIMS